MRRAADFYYGRFIAYRRLYFRRAGKDAAFRRLRRYDDVRYFRRDTFISRLLEAAAR